MIKLTALAALFCAMTFSVPAFAFSVEKCKQHCAENCSGKGNYCLGNCTTRCDRGGRH
jgi:hypothetical protein